MGKETIGFFILIICFILFIAAAIGAVDDYRINKLKTELHNATEHYKSENQRAEMFADYYRIAYRLLSPEKKKRFEEIKTKWGY